MRFEAVLAILILAGSLNADARAGSMPRPEFSATDNSIIARNEILNAIVDHDPWLVRRILDLAALNGALHSGGKLGLELSKSPDISNRNAESSLEWHELLRRARELKLNPPPIPEMQSRSSEGSVELLDMLRRVRDSKGGKPAQNAQ